MIDGFLYVRAVAALLFVLALLGVVAYVARRFSGNPVSLTKRQKRLGVVEVTAIDPKRRLVLIRRDQAEHLLLIGGAQDLVIERAIAPVSSLPETERLPRDIAPSPGRSRLDEVRF